MTSAMGTRMHELSHLAMYELRVRNNILQKRAIHVFSENKKHGWGSFIPIMQMYVPQIIDLYADDEIELKVMVINSDRGPHDFFCAPAHVYLNDIADQYDIKIVSNVGAAGHNKGMSDQIGGRVNTFLDHALFVGSLELVLNPQVSVTIANMIITYLNDQFQWDRQQQLERIFWELESADVFEGASPIKSLKIGTGSPKKGIKNFHHAFMDGSVMKYRPNTCYCDVCIRTCFEGHCRQSMYSGDWSRLRRIPIHRCFDRLNNNDNNNNH